MTQEKDIKKEPQDNDLELLTAQAIADAIAKTSPSARQKPPKKLQKAYNAF